MEETKKYLNEARYEASKAKIKKIALVVLLVGLLIGGSLIGAGIARVISIENEWKNKQETSTSDSFYDSFSSSFNETKKRMAQQETIPFYIFGGFIIIASAMVSGSLYMQTKTREILAFKAQQVMPIGKEVIDEVSPMAGKVAEEVVRGVKRGLGKSDKE